MKYLLAAWLGLVPVQDQVAEPITMTGEERAFLFHRMLDMQEQIDKLDKALRTERDRTGCA